MKPPVLTKRDFVRRFMEGEFGNKGPNWETLAEFLASDFKGLVHIRNRIAGGPTWYDVPAESVASLWQSIVADGVSDKSLYLAGMAPTHETLIQGELALSPEGLTLYYSTVKKPMRDSLREGGKQVRGIIAVTLLRHYMDPTSYEWVWSLLDEYPDHVIEFSVYNCCWGTVPKRNTIIWEVRCY